MAKRLWLSIDNFYMHNTRYLEKIKSYYYRHGFIKTFFRLLEKAGMKACYHSSHLWFMELDEPDSSLIQNVKSQRLDTFLATKSFLEEKECYFDGWYYKEEALNRIDKGHELYASSYNGEVCNYIWIEKKIADASHLDLRFLLNDSIAYLAHNYTMPSHRGYGFGAEALYGVLKKLKDSGYNRIIAFVAPENKPSIRVKQKIGFKAVYLCNYFRAFFFKIYVFKNNLTKHKDCFLTAGSCNKWIANKSVTLDAESYT